MPDSNQSPPLWDIVLIIICLVMSALFSGSETVLTSLSESRVRALMDSPNRWGTGRLKHWLHSSTRILTSLLIGNTLVNTISSILAARVAYYYLRSYAEACAIGVMTMLILVFGEIIPKTLGKLRYSGLAPWAMLFALMADRLLYPLSWVFNQMAKIVFKKIGNAVSQDEVSPITVGEIEHLIQIGEKEGVIDKGRGEMMRSVLEFKETIAKEIMVPHTRMVAISIDTNLEKAMDVAISSGHSRIPVFRGKIDNIEGILYVKDLLTIRMKPGQENVSLKDLIRKNLLFVPETEKIGDILTEMQKKRVHLAIVVDEFGATSGLITMEDIIEELVGEIRDEHDKEEVPIKSIGNGVWEAYAWVSIYDLGEALGTEIPDSGEYETLGGFLTNQYGSVPPVGKTIEWDGFSFAILDADARRINRVKITKTSLYGNDS